MPPLAVIDAFTDTPFAGNPAAVCLLARWPSDEWLQLVGREMNLSETAFLVPRGESAYELRWFTPRVEVALCGHATLASAHFLWESAKAPDARPLTFHTRKSGALTANRFASGEIELDFPRNPRRRVSRRRGCSLRSGRTRSRRRETSPIIWWNWRAPPTCVRSRPTSRGSHRWSAAG